MTGKEYSPEQLEAARNEVIDLYSGDQLEKALILGGFQDESTRDQLWAKAANTHAPFADKITELKQAFKVVSKTQKVYALVLPSFAIPFKNLEDMDAREFLEVVLFSRMTYRPGHMDFGIELPDEAQSMAQEMDIRGWRTEPGTKVTLDQVVEAALIGRLRFQYQSKQR